MSRTVHCVALAILLLAFAESRAAPHPDVLAAETARADAMREASQATIAIFMPGGQGGGSGVLISRDGYALSNYHVTQTGPALECGLPNGEVYDAVIVSVDPTGDVALIKLLGRDDFPVAELGDSDALRPGDWVFTAGNPFLLADDFTPSISFGVVSGVHRYQYPAGTVLEYADCIQTDAAINPGNSGGPLFNARGQLVGVNGRGSFEKRGRVNVGVGYAISINQIKKFLGYLKSGRVIDHASLGATVQFNEDGEVVVDEILESSDAFRRGLRYDDVIVRFADRPIGSVNTFKNVLGTLPKGWRVPITFRRNGETYDRLVRLRGAHREGELDEMLKKKPPKPIEGPDPEKQPRKDDAPPRQVMPPTPEKKQEIPKVVEAQFESRRGFINYFFNEQQRDRVWSAFAARCHFEGDDASWTLAGKMQGGGEFRLDLLSTDAALTLPRGQFAIRFDANDDLTASLDPAGSGGLFAALHVWRRLMIQGPESFGEVYYLGAAPARGRSEWADVLVGVHGGVETWFYFDQTDGDLVGLEMFSDSEWDPCEVYFDDFRDVDGRRMPHRLDVRYGDELFGAFDVQQFIFGRESNGAPSASADAATGVEN